MRRSLSIGVLLICCVLLVAAWQFTTTLREYRVLKAELEHSEALLDEAERQYDEAQRKVRIFSRVKRFVQTAEALGLEKDRWHSYEVMVEELLMFNEAREILRQCVSKEGYFFQPVYLTIDRKKREQEGAGPEEMEGRDVFFKMKGRFLVRIR